MDGHTGTDFTGASHTGADLNGAVRKEADPAGGDCSRSAKVRALVLTGFGLNCDVETAHAFELAGARADRVHINRVVSSVVDINDYHILAFGGGFSWGDDHGAGVIQALKIKKHLGDKLISFVSGGKLVIGICNGFQTLVNLGLLPGLGGDYRSRNVALTWNDCGNFRDQWVHLHVNQENPSPFTRGLDNFELPVRHAQGKFVTAPDILETLKDQGQIVLRYGDGEGRPARGKFPLNPNGSMDDIAGICDATGQVFGLMPHPEAYLHFTNHPDWTVKKERLKRIGFSNKHHQEHKNMGTPGLMIFKNAVAYAAQKFDSP
ncbi:MAG: phosphoribosylformylglycinamidine synthase subunit PurQ [Desulfamplus sp.]|nr:phosphoribosylformylglycinamidine synthase subunit PurQ [Desulfamplus sp.]